MSGRASLPRRVGRPPVLRQVSLERHGVIEASAGTGKTFTLENLVIELLLGTDVALDQLLVVTFTEKATHEIRTRVRAKLEELRSGGGEPPTEEQIRAGDFWTLDDIAREKLERALRTFDGTTIATIHAFCQSVLRDNAFASGRLFEEQQVDGRDAFGRAFREALRRDVARDPARSRWLEAALRAGSTMGRIEELLWKVVTARGELRPGFDEAALTAALAAFPLGEPLVADLQRALKEWKVHGGTVKAIVWRCERLAVAVAQWQSTGDITAFVQAAVAAEPDVLAEKLAKLTPRPGPGARVCAAALDLARATPPFTAALIHALLESVTRELARSKRVAGRYDFDDMLSLLDDALRGPRGGVLAEDMRRRWKFALIDEFQDTDETQWSIFRRAFFEPGQDEGRSVLFFVGDPKQSIYRFRGADVHAYLRARDEVVAAGGARVSLERNFRATAALVRAHNQIFDQSAAEPIFTGVIEYTAVECGRPERALTDGEGREVAPVGVLRFSGGELSADALGPWIAAQVRTLTDPARPWRLDGRALDPSDVFVLTRTGREGRAVGAALRAGGVPHSFYKEDGLFQSDEAKDIRVLLSAIDDPSDRACRLAAWLTPFFGLPLSAIESARDLPASHPLVARLHTWKALADGRAFDRLFESIVRHSGVLRREIFFADGERELTNYLHILEFLLERARDGHPTLSELVHGLSGLIDKTRAPLDVVDGNAQRIESERRAVQIMTIHKAKGLEAPVVFVAGGFTPPFSAEDVRVYHDEGRRLAWVGALSPDVESLVKEEESEEDQRLMYVALTRAMGRLVLPCLVEAEPTSNGKRDAGDARPMRGPYDRVNKRVVERLQASEGGDASAAELFAAEDVVPAAPAVLESSPSVSSWTPPMALLHDEDQSARYAALRDQHAGAIVTSYTRLRGERRERGEPRSAWGDGPEERRAQKAVESDESGAPLRGARASGVFLHEILERIPLASFAAAGLGEWRVRAEVSALFDEAIAVHRIEPAQRAHAEQLVWAAYTTPLVLPGADASARLDAGFAGASRVVREMDFVYPIPQGDQDLALAGLAGSPRAASSGKGGRGAGYIRGSLDLAFEHRGLTYFVDWKSDSLPSYSTEALGHRVATHYEDQAVLYALAVVRLLGIRSAEDHRARFGGLLYCFLRGLDASGEGSSQGMWSSRPSWDDILRWNESLRTRRHWGGAGGTS